MNTAPNTTLWKALATFADPEFPYTPDPIRKSKIKVFLAVVFTTSFFMWTYAVIASVYLDHPTMRYMGFVYAPLHLASILVLRLTRSLTLATWMVQVPGWMFQTHFSALTGGFLTVTIVWVGILPLIAGVTTNIKNTLIWSGISTLTILLFMLADSYQAFPPSMLKPEAVWIVHGMLSLGLITLISGFTVFILMLEQKSLDEQRKKTVSKATMLQTISHDITNPLTVIAALVETPSPSDLHISAEKTKKLQRSVTRIRDIISNARMIESVESGKDHLNVSEVDLTECVAAASMVVDARVAAKKIRVVYPEKTPFRVLGNQSIIENHVIANVLTNAVKFSPVGTTINVTLNRHDKYIELVISDEGAGIPQSILPHLFDPLVATTRPGTDGEKGTGFGLPIVKKFMEMMNGHVEIHSKSKAESPDEHGTDVKLFFRRGTA